MTFKNAFQNGIPVIDLNVLKSLSANHSILFYLSTKEYFLLYIYLICSQKLDDAKMANESKELPPDVQEEVKKSPGSEDGGIIGVALSVMKKVAFVGVIYLVGYMNWSVAWLIGE